MPKSTGTSTTIADASTTCEPQTSTRSSSTGSARTPSTTDSDSTTHDNMDENTDNNNEDNTGQTTPRPDLEDTLRGLRGATPKDEHSRELYQAINELDRDRRRRKSKRLAAKRQQTSAATERKGPKSGSAAMPIRSAPVESPATKEKKASRTMEHNK